MGTDAYQYAFDVVEDLVNSNPQQNALLTELTAELDAILARIYTQLGFEAVNENTQGESETAELNRPAVAPVFPS